MDDETERRIAEWRGYVGGRAAIATADVDELETHLRDQIAALGEQGLAPDEAFLIAVKRVGDLDELSSEFAREHSDRLWKQLVVGTASAPERARGLWTALAFAVGAALAVKVPTLFGITLFTATDFYLRNAPLIVLTFLAAFFLIRRRANMSTILAVAIPFAAVAVVLNTYPFAASGQTLMLAAIHAIVALWLVVGIAHADGAWRSSRARMDFVRFTGEWFIYFVLIALGGAALCALTIGVFGAVGLNATGFVQDWLLPCGAAGAVVIAAWLVEAKQSVIENIAPVLTRVFAPLVTLMLVAALVAGLIQFDVIENGRDLLIIFDLVLIVVLALLLYAMSARDPDATASWTDRLYLVMLLAALVLDVLVLIAMIGRIGVYGASANKLASLGLNLILLANLAGAAWLQLGFVRHRIRFAVLERWQMSFVPVYLAWAAIVVVVFPPVFSFA